MKRFWIGIGFVLIAVLATAVLFTTEPGMTGFEIYKIETKTSTATGISTERLFLKYDSGWVWQKIPSDRWFSISSLQPENPKEADLQNLLDGRADYQTSLDYLQSIKYDTYSGYNVQVLYKMPVVSDGAKPEVGGATAALQPPIYASADYYVNYGVSRSYYKEDNGKIYVLDGNQWRETPYRSIDEFVHFLTSNGLKLMVDSELSGPYEISVAQSTPFNTGDNPNPEDDPQIYSSKLIEPDFTPIYTVYFDKVPVYYTVNHDGSVQYSEDQGVTWEKTFWKENQLIDFLSKQQKISDVSQGEPVEYYTVKYPQSAEHPGTPGAPAAPASQPSGGPEAPVTGPSLTLQGTREMNDLQKKSVGEKGLTSCVSDVCNCPGGGACKVMQDGTVLKITPYGGDENSQYSEVSICTGKMDCKPLNQKDPKDKQGTGFKVTGDGDIVFIESTSKQNCDPSKPGSCKAELAPTHYVIIDGQRYEWDGMGVDKNGNIQPEKVNSADGSIVEKYTFKIKTDSGEWQTYEQYGTGSSAARFILLGTKDKYGNPAKMSLERYNAMQKFGAAMREWQSDIAAGQYISILFGTQNSAWRKTWDEFFVHNVLGSVISGRWEESLCHHYIEKAPGGALYITIPDGQNLVGIGAFVAAERTEVLFENASGQQKEYYYKINVYAKNPESARVVGQAFDQDMDFNVQLIGQRTVNLFTANQHVGPGESFVKTGTKMIVKESMTRYDTICMKFTSSIRTANGEEVSEVCNSIATYSGAATRIQVPKEEGKTSAGPGDQTNTI